MNDEKLPESWGEEINSESLPWNHTEQPQELSVPSKPPKARSSRPANNTKYSPPHTQAVQQAKSGVNQNTMILFIVIIVLALIIIVGGILFVVYLRKQSYNQNTAASNHFLASDVNSSLSDNGVFPETKLQVTETVPEIVTELPTDSPTEPPTELPDPEYTVIMGKYTWEEAEKYCVARNGHLATIHSESEWNKMMEAVEAAQRSNPELKYLWLGATSQLSSDMKVSFSWVDGSETNFIMSSTTHWYYNERIDVMEPSGYDAYEYQKNGNLIREPYLLLWNVAPKGGSSENWSMNDVPDVSEHENYKSSNMGFIMRIN